MSFARRVSRAAGIGILAGEYLLVGAALQTEETAVRIFDETAGRELSAARSAYDAARVFVDHPEKNAACSARTTPDYSIEMCIAASHLEAERASQQIASLERERSSIYSDHDWFLQLNCVLIPIGMFLFYERKILPKATNETYRAVPPPN